MSGYPTQFKKQKKLGGSLVLACFVLTMLGCSRSDDNADKNSTNTSSVQTETKSSAVDCGNEKANAAITEFLKNKINQQATNQAQLIEQQASTAVDINILRNSLSQVAISLQGINNTPTSCKATVSFDLPQSEIDDANKIYTRLHQPVLAEQVVSRGYELQGNTLVAKNLSFDVNHADGSYQVAMKNGDDATGLVAEILANSSLTKTLTGSNSPVTASATATSNVTVPTGIESTNSGQKPTTVRETTTKPHHKPKTNTTTNDSEKPKSSTRTVSSSTKYTTIETTTRITPRNSDSQSNDNDTTVTETRTVTTKKDNQPEQTTHRTVTHERVPTDNNIKLNIEEKNEQY